MKTLAGIVVGVVTVLIAVNAWMKRRAAMRDAEILAELITPPVQTFRKLATADSEAVQAKASARRAAYTYQRKRSAQIASGEPVERIRIVGGRR